MSSGQPPEQRQVSYEDVQYLAREVESFQQQRSVFLQQFELMAHTITELENSQKAIREIQLREKNDTILLPLGPQMLLEVGLVNTESVIFLLGSKISKDISMKQADEKLVTRIKQARKAMTDLQTQINKLDELITVRQQFLQSLVPLGKQN